MSDTPVQQTEQGRPFDEDEAITIVRADGTARDWRVREVETQQVYRDGEYVVIRLETP